MKGIKKYLPIVAFPIAIYATIAVPDISHNSRLEKKVISSPIYSFTGRDLLPKREEEIIIENYREPKKLETIIETPNTNYTPKELKELSKIIYAEMANKNEKIRELAGRVVANRVKDSGYPHTYWGVIHQKNGFSCTFDGNKNWAQANGLQEMNEYEIKKFKDCEGDAKDVLEGKMIGIPRETEIIAFHTLKETPNTNYWKGLDMVYHENGVSFFAPKK